MIDNNSARILIVDDDFSTRMLMHAALDDQDYDIDMATNGNEALEKFEQAAFDVVMLDVEMPEKNGYETCSELRSKFGHGFPIIMVTGMGDVESIQHAFSYGATDFITKPINWTLISYRVKYILRSYQVLQQLKSLESRNMAMLMALPDSLLRIDYDGSVLDVLGSALGGLGLEKGFSLSETLSSNTHKILMDALRKAIDLNQMQEFNCTLTARDDEDQYYEGRVVRVDEKEAICLLRDVTSLSMAKQKVNQLTHFDRLTGLPNRFLFNDMLASEIERYQESGKLAVLLMDLDGFVEVNDSLGRVVGDELLRLVAKELEGVLSSMDGLASRWGGGRMHGTLAHMGGDKFGLLLMNIHSAEDVLVTVNEIRRQLLVTRHVDGHDLVMSASFGISCYPNDSTDADLLIKFADTAMYAAKSRGRDQCLYYNPALTERALAKLTLEEGLRHALDNDEFVVYYQPQVDSFNKSIQSVEALVRWNRPQFGIVSPIKFIGLAEETHLIHAIGEKVLRTACQDAVSWDQLGMPPLRVAVNLSVVQFHNPGLLDMVQRILSETRLPPDRLELEITESVLLEDANQVLNTLAAFRRLGIHIGIDDFGTGFSSLGYLRNMPVTNLKIDRSFVMNLPESSGDVAIIQAIVALSKGLGVQVTAEGVETQEQAILLSQLGCNVLQGYFYGKPQPFEDIVALFITKFGEDKKLVGIYG
ncbi:MAG: EAL domain-containing protein [Methylotenera sp.]|nr:EAL domain-containing protein [Methylotenera sp.]